MNRPVTARQEKATVAPWRRDWRLYLTALTVSVSGGAVSGVALPLLAVVVLDASVWQAAVLTAAQRFPPLLTSLLSGALVDRHLRLPLLIGCDVLRMVALGSIPAAAAFGALTLAQLYAVALVVAAAHDVHSIAGIAYLPTLVPPGE